MIKINGIEINFETFPNGETKMMEHEINLALKGKNNEVYFKYNSDGDLIKLFFVKSYIDSLRLVEKTRLLISYMPYSRMDRVENNSAFTLKYIANFINSMNFFSVMIIEAHSDVSVALINNSFSNLINFNLLPKVIEDINFDIERDTIVFPDAGASKRYSKMKYKNILIGNKERNFKTGKIIKLDLIGDVKQSIDRKAIIVDDLSSYGGTFIMTAEKLRERGYSKIYLLVAHAERSVFAGELFNHIDKLFTTNSILSEDDYLNSNYPKEKLEVYDIKWNLGDVKQ